MSGNHYYRAVTGKPCYEVPKKTGSGMRAVTIADARKLFLVPSVTTVLNIMDKQALTYWKCQQAALATLEVLRHAFTEEELWLKAVLAESTKTTKKAADVGTEIHDALEKVFKGEIPRKYTPLAASVASQIWAYCDGTFKWDVEKYFAHPLGYGGRCDLSSQEGNGIVIDYKTKKDFKRNAKGVIPKLAYDNHVQQLTAYAHGLGLPNARLINVFIEYSGETHIVEWQKPEIDRAWQMFKLTLELWKVQKKYESSY